VLFQGTLNISVFTFTGFPFVFSLWITSLEGFKQVCREHMLDRFWTAVHKGHDFSLEN